MRSYPWVLLLHKTLQKGSGQIGPNVRKAFSVTWAHKKKSKRKNKRWFWSGRQRPKGLNHCSIQSIIQEAFWSTSISLLAGLSSTLLSHGLKRAYSLKFLFKSNRLYFSQDAKETKELHNLDGSLVSGVLFAGEAATIRLLPVNSYYGWRTPHNPLALRFNTLLTYRESREGHPHSIHSSSWVENRAVLPVIDQD